MPFQTITKPSAGTELDYLYWDKIRSNIHALRDVNYSSYTHTSGSPASWTHNTLTYVEIDSTKFRLSITTTGGGVVVGFTGSFRRPVDGQIGLDINHYIGSVADANYDPLDKPNNGVGATPVFCITWTPHTLIKPYLSLLPGTHIFTMMWALSGGSTANIVTLDGVTYPQMWVMELN